MSEYQPKILQLSDGLELPCPPGLDANEVRLAGNVCRFGDLTGIFDGSCACGAWYSPRTRAWSMTWPIEREVFFALVKTTASFQLDASASAEVTSAFIAELGIGISKH